MKRGLLVSLSADDFAVGDTVGYIPNKGVVEGYFETQKAPVIVAEQQGKKAFRLKENSSFVPALPCRLLFVTMLLIRWRPGC